MHRLRDQDQDQGIQDQEQEQAIHYLRPRPHFFGVKRKKMFSRPHPWHTSVSCWQTSAFTDNYIHTGHLYIAAAAAAAAAT